MTIVQADTSPGPPKVFALAFRSDGELLVGTVGRGLLMSSERTRNWTVPEGPAFAVNSITATSDQRLYAGTVGRGVVTSIDGGLNWTTVGIGLTDVTVYAVLPFADGVLAGTDGKGVAWLAPGDVEWRWLDNLPPTIYRLVAANGAVLAATLEHGVVSVPVPGRHHDPVAQLPGLTVHALWVHRGRLYAGTSGAGLHGSGDSGQSWQPVAPAVVDPVVHCLAGQGMTLLAGTASGVFASGDGGMTWSDHSKGLACRRIFSVAIADDRRFFAGGYDAVWSSAGPGSRWQRVPTGLMAQEIYAVAVEPSGVTLAGGHGRLWSSADGGATWTATEEGLAGRTVHGLSIAAGHGRYLATDDGVLADHPGDGWVLVGLPGHCVLAVAATSDRVFAATLGHGLWVSADRGRNWAQVENFTCPTATDVCVTSAGVFATGLDSRAGSKTGGVFRIDDTGIRCRRVAAPQLAAYRIGEGPDGCLYVGAHRSTILRSDDSGFSWQTFATTGLVDSKLYALTVGADGQVYIGTDAGVLASTDRGVSWQPRREDSTDGTPYSIAVTTAGDVICGTSQGVRVMRPAPIGQQGARGWG